MKLLLAMILGVSSICYSADPVVDEPAFVTKYRADFLGAVARLGEDPKACSLTVVDVSPDRKQALVISACTHKPRVCAWVADAEGLGLVGCEANPAYVKPEPKISI